ncbi:hypothetical protein ACFSLT_24100 [Novosphingobium resinovorum]
MQLATFFGIIGTGLAVIGLARTPGEMVVGLCIQQTAAGMAVPMLVAWAQTKFPFEHRGRGMGIWTGAFFFGQFSSPWLVHQMNLATGTMQGPSSRADARRWSAWRWRSSPPCAPARRCRARPEPLVIASGAKQSRRHSAALDCFAPLAMTAVWESDKGRQDNASCRPFL